MKTLLIAAACSIMLFSCGSPPPAEETTDVVPVDTTPKPVEFADASYMDIGKQMFGYMSSGDMDKYMEAFAEDAVYGWNNGDSLAGKAAIGEFWKKRRSEAIESITFSNQIFLPVKVNQPQSVESPGVWLLAWHQVDVVYKNKKTMTQWMHLTIHFNDNKLIDRMNQYLDMAPVNAAMPLNTAGK